MADRTYDEAAVELNLPKSWLQKRAQAYLIPHRRYGRHVRFTDEDIAAIRAQHATKPIAPPNGVVVQMRRRAA